MSLFLKKYLKGLPSLFSHSASPCSVFAMFQLAVVFPFVNAIRSGFNICIYEIPPLGIILLIIFTTVILPLGLLAILLLCKRKSSKLSSVLSSVLFVLFSYCFFLLVSGAFLPPLYAQLLSIFIVLILLVSHKIRFVREFMLAFAFASIFLPLYLAFSSELPSLIFPPPLKKSAILQNTKTPTLVIVFDELPNTSLLNENEEVDPILFPNLAWFH